MAKVGNLQAYPKEKRRYHASRVVWETHPPIPLSKLNSLLFPDPKTNVEPFLQGRAVLRAEKESMKSAASGNSGGGSVLTYSHSNLRVLHR